MKKLFPFAIWPHNAGLMKAATPRMPFAGMRLRDVHEMLDQMAVAPRDTFGPIVERPHRTQASNESSDSVPVHVDAHTPRHGHFGPAYVAWVRELPVGSFAHGRDDVLDDIHRGKRYDSTPKEVRDEDIRKYGPQTRRQIDFGARTVHDPKSHAHIFHAYLPPGSTESWLDPKIHQPIFDALKTQGIKSIQINVPNSMKSINAYGALSGSGDNLATPDEKQEIIKQELLARRMEDLFHKQTGGAGAEIDPNKTQNPLKLKDLQDFTGASDRPIPRKIASSNKTLLSG